MTNSKLVLIATGVLLGCAGTYYAIQKAVTSRAAKLREQDVKDHLNGEVEHPVDKVPAINWIEAMAKIKGLADNYKTTVPSTISKSIQWVKPENCWNNGTDYFSPLLKQIKLPAEHQLYISNTPGKNNRLIFILTGAAGTPNKVWFQRYTGDTNLWACQHNLNVGPMTFAAVMQDISSELAVK